MSLEGLNGSPELKNVVEVETSNAHYRIVYENHYQINDPKIWEGSDAVLLESSGSGAVGFYFSEKKREKSIVEYAKRNKKAIFFVDPTEHSLRPVVTSAGPVAIEALVGMDLIKSAVKDVNLPSKISRREMLKKSVKAGAKLIGGAHLMSPAVSLAVSAASQKLGTHSPVGEISRGINRYNDVAHPETGGEIVTFRNLVMADSSEAAAKFLQRQLKRKPHLTLIVGAHHTEVENSLRMNAGAREERINSSFYKKYHPHLDDVVVVDFSSGDSKTPRIYSIENSNIK